MAATLRAFIAAELPVELREALAGFQEQLRRRGLRARWVRPAGIHLTLKFLGDIPAGQVPLAAQAMSESAGAQSAFPMEAAGIGVFPGPRRPRVIWAGLHGAVDALEGLQARLDSELGLRGFPREPRPFRGHLTLGRFAVPVDAELLARELTAEAATVFGRLTVNELVLFRSELQPAGAVYTALARARLKESF